MFRFLLALLAISSVGADPQVLPLRSFSGLATSLVNGAESGAKLYLASSDANIYLKNIKITTGGTTYTLDQLNDFNDNGTPKYYLLAGDLWISTTNNASVTQSLTGNLYMTSRLQANDPSFSVYVIKTQHSISVDGMQSTVVILNTERQEYIDVDQPLKNSYVTNIDQSPNTNLYFQWGFPSADWHNDVKNTFFENPMNLLNDTVTARVFFDHVEPLQVGLDYWYFTVMGPINMMIENKYVSNHNYTTTSANTTGLLTSNMIFLEHVVNFVPDNTRSGNSGFFMSGFTDNNLGFYLEAGTGQISEVLNGEGRTGDKLWTYGQATKLTVNSTTNMPGTFYCQYFTFAGDLFPVTLPTTSTTLAPTTTSGSGNGGGVTSTTTVATTTKGTSSMVGGQLMIALLFVVFKFS